MIYAATVEEIEEELCRILGDDVDQAAL